jgi:small membrane protein
MQSIKIVLILCFIGVIIGVFRHRRRVELRAGSRILALLLFLLAVVSVADPNLTVVAANAMGVARGTDLILYALVVIFVLTSLGLYFRSREVEQRLLDLARAVAIGQAIQLQGVPGSEPAVQAREPSPCRGSNDGTDEPSNPRSTSVSSLEDRLHDERGSGDD